ncbi:MAG: hypothetical protein UV63_C0065G0001 [Microgenomates group bacterium GW2011_GWC1_43_11]|nr:MAG: hypothetical protein UV63_C0065G0001 [Microgenomates group bacterium GW2011_GWC1_43_11]HCM82914.1 hypothetical protein [Patescibacteria group bacterium]
MIENTPGKISMVETIKSGARRLAEYLKPDQPEGVIHLDAEDQKAITQITQKGISYFIVVDSQQPPSLDQV